MSLDSDVKMHGEVHRLQPIPIAENTDGPARLSRYGAVVVESMYGGAKHPLVEEGSYLVAINPTISTGMTQVAAQTAFSDTAPNLYIFNAENPGNPNAKSIYMDYVKMIATAAATAATSIQYAFVLDSAQRAPTTDNTQALTIVNPNGNAPNLISPVVRWQNSATASVIPASSAAKRVVGRGCLGGLNVAGDVMRIVFGSTDVGSHAGLTAVQAAALRNCADHSPAIIVPPGWSLVGHLWAPASTASWNPEVEVAFWAR